MPKRVIDADAMWSSDKLAACAEWAQAEYAWLYGLADASGSFEITNLRVIWGRVAAIRRNFTIERLEQVFDEFGARGLLFRWEASGKRYAHWTGSDVPGRLPAPSWRVRLEKLAPPVPRKELQEYMAQFSSGVKQNVEQNCDREFSTGGECDGSFGQAHSFRPSGNQNRNESTGLSALKLGLESPQAQDLNSDLNLNQDENQKQKSARQLPFPQTFSKQTSNQNLPEEKSEGEYRAAAARAFAHAVRSLDPWGSATSSKTPATNSATPSADSRGARVPGRLDAAQSYASSAAAARAHSSRSYDSRPQTSWWQSRQDAKALQLERELNVGRGPQLPPLRARRDASEEKTAEEKTSERAKGAANTG